MQNQIETFFFLKSLETKQFHLSLTFFFKKKILVSLPFET
jgi:hypothetical protein